MSLLGQIGGDDGGDSGGQCTPFNSLNGPEAPPERGSLLPELRIRMGRMTKWKMPG